MQRIKHLDIPSSCLVGVCVCVCVFIYAYYHSKVGPTNILLKTLILLFSNNALNRSNVTVKTYLHFKFSTKIIALIIIRNVLSTKSAY